MAFDTRAMMDACFMHGLVHAIQHAAQGNRFAPDASSSAKKMKLE